MWWKCIPMLHNIPDCRMYMSKRCERDILPILLNMASKNALFLHYYCSASEDTVTPSMTSFPLLGFSGLSGHGLLYLNSGQIQAGLSEQRNGEIFGLCWCMQDTYVIYNACFQKSTICAEWIAMNCHYRHNVDVTLWCCDVTYMETGVCIHQ